MIRTSLRVIALAAAAALVPAGSTATATAAPQPTTTQQQSASHLGATWDAPNTRVKIYDPHAVSATVVKTIQQSVTDNPVCDLYIATYTLTFTAINGHRLTAEVTQDDNFGESFTALDTTVFKMTPDAVVASDQAPTQQLWFLKGTHQSSAQCPPNLRTTNHVEIYVSGKGPRITHSIVRPPSERHLAAVWTWPTGVRISSPPRITVNLNIYQELGTPQGACQETETEIDVSFTAREPARIIAVGVHAPGTPTHYQNGNADSFVLGAVGHEWFLTGTHTKSRRCPADTVSTDRIEVYTDVLSFGDADDD